VRPDVIVVGDVMLDVGVEAEALARGGDVHGEVRVRPGGGGANAAVWAAAGGARVRLYGRIGDDVPGRILRQALAERGVETALALDPDVRTGSMLVVRQSGDRSMVADRGANARLRPSDLPEELEAAAVLVSGYLLFDPGSERAAVTALERARARVVAVDAASWPLVRDFGPDRFFELTRSASLVFANELESQMLGGGEAEVAARRLVDHFPMACVKLGSRGAAFASRDGLTHRVRPSRVSEGDPTGAGDAFDGAFLAAMASGEDIEQALERACVAGARAADTMELWP
jgi:sugar/nucleoside kinase (ribokinase family)